MRWLLAVAALFCPSGLAAQSALKAALSACLAAAGTAQNVYPALEIEDGKRFSVFASCYGKLADSLFAAMEFHAEQKIDTGGAVVRFSKGVGCRKSATAAPSCWIAIDVQKPFADGL